MACGISKKCSVLLRADPRKSERTQRAGASLSQGLPEENDSDEGGRVYARGYYAPRFAAAATHRSSGHATTVK